MNFQVPQFIEEKAKIVGFLTIQQFLLLIGAGGACFLFFNIFNFFIAFLLSLVVGGAAVVLALGKVNGQSAFKMLGSAAEYAWRPRRYTWQRKFAETSLNTSGIEAIEAARRKIGIQEKLKSIALSVTTGKLFSGLAQPGSGGKERFQVVTYLTGEKKVAKRIDYR
jgi:hypothetical protein